MNRRARRSSSPNSYLRYLKPGALAQLRDSRISARTHRAIPRPGSPQISSPSRSSPSPVQPSHDEPPCFYSGRIYSPRCPQRKKLVAAKSVLFSPSSPGPVSESPGPTIDLLSNSGVNDILVAH